MWAHDAIGYALTEAQGIREMMLWGRRYVTSEGSKCKPQSEPW